jgi:hypothetical protein
MLRGQIIGDIYSSAKNYLGDEGALRSLDE